MGALRPLAPVDLDSVPEYPVDPAVRLDTHEFLRWEFRRWLASDLRWRGSHECKSMWFDLLNMAYAETPVGTLPHDVGRLARMVQPVVDPEHFAALCTLPHGPLHGWAPCRCGDDLRLAHPVVTRIVMSAMASRANHAARVEAASKAKRLKRLTEDVMQLAPDLAQKPDVIRFIDRHIQESLTDRGGVRRTAADLHDAVQAYMHNASQTSGLT